MFKQIRKASLCGIFLIALSANLFSQILFSYGKRQVSKQEFLNAFNKNLPDTADRNKVLNNYLNLYINYKLKVQAAYDEKLDETDSYRLERLNFKKQITEGFINEEANEKALLLEAIERGKKDIEIAQLFVEFGKDSAAAYKSIQSAYLQLKSGKNFNDAVQQFSTDESSKKKNGYIGYITVFTLPYEIENEIYKLKPGGISTPFKSKYGYHIFKELGERPSMGKRKIEQILLSFPPNATEADKKRIASIANELYQEILSGKAFDLLAKQFSNDNSSASNGGILADISIGEYSSDFEEPVFSLQKAGDVSKPFATGYGYHIIKLVEIIPVVKSSEDMALKQSVENSDRLLVAKRNLIKKWLVLTGYRKASFDEKELWRYTDSCISNRSISSFKKINDSTVLLSFSKQKFTVKDFIEYAKKQAVAKAHTVLLKEFTDQMCNDYYRLHLEEYNSRMKDQLNQFDEANLLFTAMDKHVWNKAGLDSVGLKDYYIHHQSKYTWAPGVAAILVSAINIDLANDAANKIKQTPGEWRSIASSYGSSLSADSGRYENSQLRFKQPLENKPGFVSVPEKSATDDSYSFAYVTAVFTDAAQRSFEEAKGIVINDYQQLLEDKWLADLKKKYPVKVNESVWKTVK